MKRVKAVKISEYTSERIMDCIASRSEARRRASGVRPCAKPSTTHSERPVDLVMTTRSTGFDDEAASRLIETAANEQEDPEIVEAAIIQLDRILYGEAVRPLPNPNDARDPGFEDAVVLEPNGLPFEDE